MGRGRSSSGGSNNRGGSGDSPSPNVSQDDVEALVDDPNGPSTPEEAADALGLDGKDKEHFVNGARIPRVGRDESELTPKPGNGKGDVPGRAPDGVIAYERKYGRGAARAYSQGGFWSLLRAIRRVVATTSTVTNPSNLPGNAALLAAYAFAKNPKGAR